MRIKNDKVNIDEILQNGRFDAPNYISSEALMVRLINHFKGVNVDEIAFIHKVRNRNSRIYVEDRSRGLKYISNTDMQKSSYDSIQYMSKKFLSNVEEQKLKVGDIVISAVGTIGQVAYINNCLKDAVVSGNILRITPNKDGGFIYAYLMSKYGQANLKNMSSGSVQDFITPPKLAKLKIPKFPEIKQQVIHQLIVDAADLRVEANRLLEEAHCMIHNQIDEETTVDKTHSISIRNIKSSYTKRFEASYFKSEGNSFKKIIEKRKFKLLKDLCLPIFRPGIFKRVYVEKGIEFLGGSDINKAIPSSEKKLSVSKTKNLETLKIEDNWILVTCGGTIGFTLLTDEMEAGKTASQHILRIRPRNIKVGYLYAFLSSDIGKKSIQSFTYGSVIPQIEPHHLDRLPIPIFDDLIMDAIDDLIMNFKGNILQSKKNEQKAIQLIETEIDSWHN